MEKTEIKKTITPVHKNITSTNTKELMKDITLAESILSDVTDFNSALKNFLLRGRLSDEDQFIVDLIFLKIEEEVDFCGSCLKTAIEKVNAGFSGEETLGKRFYD